MKIFQFIIILVFLSLSTVSIAQQYDDVETFDYSEVKEYEIGGVNVVGAETRDRNAILTISGLQVGSKVRIPGDDIPNAVKSLWKLRLFDDVQILQEKIESDLLFLEIFLRERPTYSKHSFKGVKKVHHDELNTIVEDVLSKGSIITDDRKQLVTIKIIDYFMGKGFLDTKVKIREIPDKDIDNAVRLIVDINPKERVKIDNINFEGVTAFKEGKLRRKLKETKQKKAIFKKSKFVKEDYEGDKQSLIAFYNTRGYKNAKIVSDSVYRNKEGELMIDMVIKEGNVFLFRDITWKGNSKYNDDQLNTILGLAKGDVFNPELLEKRLRFSQDGRDISSLYLDDGYLFFDVQPVEVAVQNDSVDIEMRIYEGPQATIDQVTIAGNDRTHEHVIRRAIRTHPGQKFSRSDIIRSQREISNLGYFNPETMDIQTPVNQERGTVDINYVLEERPSDQLELSAGYGGFQGLIGTLGLAFNNFSLRNIRDRSKWNPLPQGDGQKFSVRVQSNSRFFRSANISFTEPWLGGKKPNSFTVGAVYTGSDYSLLNQGQLNIVRVFAGLGRQLKWPDDFFSSSTTLTYENIILDNYSFSGFFVDNVPVTSGKFNNISLTQTFSRSSISEPIYPTSGSRMSLSLKVTPPYSLFKKDLTVGTLSPDDEDEIRRTIDFDRGPANPATDADYDAAFDAAKLSQRFKFLEYHKWRFDAEWYYSIVGKLVLAANLKFGILGYYNDDIGIGPFERFELGGDGLSNQNVGITGRDIISLRGYETTDIEANNNRGGASIFNKATLELRYPISTNPSSTIYLHGFVQGGNSWIGFKNFNPFEMRRSAGGGLRVFLPMFGLLGFDYGWGFDNPQTFGNFSIVLGFEPD